MEQVARYGTKESAYEWAQFETVRDETKRELEGHSFKASWNLASGKNRSILASSPASSYSSVLFLAFSRDGGQLQKRFCLLRFSRAGAARIKLRQRGIVGRRRRAHVCT